MDPVFLEFNSNQLASDLFLTPEEVQDLMSDAVKTVTRSFAAAWEREAVSKLKSSRQQYVSSLVVVDEGRMEGAVVLVGQLPNMIESGASEFDIKCIANRSTPIYTSKGWVPICNVQVGDLVLTHTGKFKRVLKTFKYEVTNETLYRIKVKVKQNRGQYQKIIVTGNHPFLTERGWIKAENLIKSDRLIVTAEKCHKCGKLINCKYIVSDQKVYCNRSCAAQINNEFRRRFGRPDLNEKARKRIGFVRGVVNKRLAAEGKHPAQHGNGLYRKIQEMKLSDGWGFQRTDLYPDSKMMDIQHKAAVAIGRRHNFTDPESKIWPSLKNLGFERQVMFKRDELKIHRGGKTNRWYFFDFAIPDLKICVEVNGERYHTKEEDVAKKREVEAKGWRYLSFWSQDIYRDLVGCVNQVIRVLRNHTGEYFFSISEFSIEKVALKKLGTVYKYKYNLTVEDDSSFIASGIVVHNSGLLASPKAKIGKDGKRYITVPFKVGAPGSLPENFNGGVLPAEVHQVVKSLSTDPVTGKSRGTVKEDLPVEFQMPKVKSLGGGRQYAHKNSIYEGVRKSVDRVGNVGYESFRRVSENSDPLAFIHPGLEARHLAEAALAHFDLPSEVGRAIDEWWENH